MADPLTVSLPRPFETPALLYVNEFELWELPTGIVSDVPELYVMVAPGVTSVTVIEIALVVVFTTGFPAPSVSVTLAVQDPPPWFARLSEAVAPPVVGQVMLTPPVPSEQTENTSGPVTTICAIPAPQVLPAALLLPSPP